MKGGWVYIVASRPFGTLYVGVTNDIVRRVGEHRQREGNGFAARYAVVRLVYFERHEEIEGAIRREKRLKHWTRAWKLDLIGGFNPEWADLYPAIVG